MWLWHLGKLFVLPELMPLIYKMKRLEKCCQISLWVLCIPKYLGQVELFFCETKLTFPKPMLCHELETKSLKTCFLTKCWSRILQTHWVFKPPESMVVMRSTHLSGAEVIWPLALISLAPTHGSCPGLSHTCSLLPNLSKGNTALQSLERGRKGEERGWRNRELKK